MSKYTDIIARLEKAEGPDRVLGEDVLLACGWRKVPTGYFYGQMHWWAPPPPNDGRGFDADNFRQHNPLASLDAAIGLVERQIATEGRKLICFFCAGGQLTPFNADKHSPDYHPLAKIDNSVTVGWMAHVAFYCADGGTSGPESYSHGRTAPIAILIALFRALEAQEPTP